MLETFKKVMESEELKGRILFTLVMVAVFRIGSFIPCPFVSVSNLRDSFANNPLMSGAFGVADMFTGGAFSKMTIMSLGIMPYISASIIFQLLMIVWPRLEKMSKEGESGRKKINQWTRYGAVILGFVQGIGLGLFMHSNPEMITPFMLDHTTLFLLLTATSIATGTTLLMWIGEKITERGIGNGISLLIALGIIAAYLPHFREALAYIRLESMTEMQLLITLALSVAMIMMIVYVQEGERRIPIQHAKQAGGGRRVAVSQSNYLPLKVNTAGVMPVIFASAILTLPATVFGWIGAKNSGAGWFGELFSPVSRYNVYTMFDLQKGSIFLLLKAFNLYTLSFIVLTIFFCFFYTAIVFRPDDVADNLRKSSAFVPGYRPGKPTAEFIDKVMSRITLAGAVFLCMVAIVPQFLNHAFDIPYTVANFAGGTGLIIVVSVVVDTMKQMQSRLLRKHYEGVKTRRSASASKRWLKESKV